MDILHFSNNDDLLLEYFVNMSTFFLKLLEFSDERVNRMVLHVLYCTI